MSAAPRALLDTCVLYPPLLRGFLLALADRGLFAPLWSEAIGAEWLHLAARRGDLPGADAALRAMQARWPEAQLPAAEAGHLDLPDAGDRHVLAAAISGRAELIVTANLRDFPRRLLAPYGLHARAPDDFAMDLWLAAPAPVEAEVARLWPGLEGRARRRALGKAGLARLGRALES
ncbi:MAG: PIN domain-containing protein [Pararhodobacter sp.]|nr:PIN domain-containing protein [Pararhodobacter sp.]